MVAALPATPQGLFTDEFLTRLANPTGGLAEALTANDDPCDWRPTVPVRLYAGEADRGRGVQQLGSCQETLTANGTHDTKVVNLGPTDHFTSA